MDWVDGFLAYTANITSPEIFRRWAAISTLAGALERRVWVRTLGSDLYPNLYVLLVAPPGVGKTEVTWRVREMWKSVPDLHIAYSSVTKAALIDNLADSTRSIMRPNSVPAVITFNSLNVSINELGVLIPAYDNEFMNILTDLYDCKHYSEKRRSKNLAIEIERPHLNLLGGCTPSYLTATMPEGAWDQGFTSRTILIYSGEPLVRDLFAEEDAKEAERDQLQAALKDIGEVYGKFTFTPEASEAINNWHMQGGPPKPDHPRLFHYNTRRTVHALKLSMIASISASLDLTITLEHVQRAIDWLIEAEVYMPDIFKAMASGGPGQLMEETWHFVFTAYNKAGKVPVPETRVVNYLSQRTPAHNVTRVLEVLIGGGLLKKGLGKNGVEYTPATKQA